MALLVCATEQSLQMLLYSIKYLISAAHKCWCYLSITLGPAVKNFEYNFYTVKFLQLQTSNYVQSFTVATYLWPSWTSPLRHNNKPKCRVLPLHMY